MEDINIISDQNKVFLLKDHFSVNSDIAFISYDINKNLITFYEPMENRKLCYKYKDVTISLDKKDMFLYIIAN